MGKHLQAKIAKKERMRKAQPQKTPLRDGTVWDLFAKLEVRVLRSTSF